MVKKKLNELTKEDLNWCMKHLQKQLNGLPVKFDVSDEANEKIRKSLDKIDEEIRHIISLS